MQTQRDLLDEVRAQLLCDYISDMRFEPYNSAAKKVLAGINFAEYSLRALSDAAEYLYGVNLQFNDHSQAEAFFKV